MAISGIKSSSKCCIPGELLYSEGSGYVAGNGCYEIHGQIRAGLAGFVQIASNKNQVLFCFCLTNFYIEW
jgi:exosome complex RNA-binding protein Rrp4